MGSHLRCVLVLGLAAVPARLATAQETIEIHIVNHYFAYINVAIGNAARGGRDSLGGTLTRQSDGSWMGEVTATVRFGQAMKALGVEVCAPKDPKADPRYLGSQRLTVTGTPVNGFNSLTQTITYQNGTADGGFLVLALKPVAQPSMSRTDCVDLYQRSSGGIPLLPLNDARWIQGPGYVIGLPQSGVLEYRDGTVQMSQDPNELDPKTPFAVYSFWEIRVERR